MAPAGLPKGLDTQINADIMAVLGKPEIGRLLVDMGIEFSPQGPTEFAAYIAAEVARFAAVSKLLGTKLG